MGFINEFRIKEILKKIVADSNIIFIFATENANRHFKVRSSRG